MQVLIIILFAAFHLTSAFGQSKPTQTEIIIIGTIHTGNKSFNHKTLFEILKLNEPNIILWEQSTKFKPVFGLRTAQFLKIWRPGIEQLSLQKYVAFNKTIQILPFDTIIPSRKNYIKYLKTTKESFHDSLYIAKKTISDSTIYADFRQKLDLYYGLLDTATLSRINQVDIINKSRELYYLEEKLILPLGKKYISDSLIINNFSTEIRFWNDRNEHMVNQIKMYANQFAGNRIIILTGLDHKYYLLDKLKEKKLNNVKLIDFLD